MLTGAVEPRDLIILTPSGKPAADAAQTLGARINPALEDLAEIRALVLAVKPANWREALAGPATHLPEAAIVISVMAGVRAAEIAAVANRPVARVMPTTGVAQARGVAALWAAEPAAGALARSLFEPLGEVVELGAEDQIDAATAVAGSAPAFIHAFVQALAAAGVAEGLPDDAAHSLARGALRSAGAGAETGLALDDLIGRIASPGGTTRAGLDAMAASGELDRAATAAVAAATRRAREF